MAETSPSTEIRARRRLRLILTLAVIAGYTCDRPQLPHEPDAIDKTLLVTADLQQMAVATVVVQVTAMDIATPLIFNLPIVGGVATGTITISTGSSRTITMSAFDSTGSQTHSGSVTIDIIPGMEQTINVTLAPLAGGVPINATLAGGTVLLTPAADTLGVGDTLTVTASASNAGGNPVSTQFSWATLDPAVLQVSSVADSTALVTALAVGEGTVVASTSGIGGAIHVVVSPAPALATVATGLAQPIYVTAPSTDSSRLFVVLRGGTIRVIRNDTLLAAPFLDISSQVNSTSGEFGLLSMAFHPDYAQNGFFYVIYVDNGSNSIVERYTVSSDPDVADAASVLQLLSVPQPQTNHNANLVAFGPDGMLYISFGDGGGQNDPSGNGQDSTNLFGSILRVDVDGGTPFAIPADNPFAGHPTARQEIWLYGLRNPWRFSFDRVTGDLYIGDVGQDALEEVDFIPASSSGGENLGWDVMEGTSCHEPATGCNQTGLTLPVLEYSHTPGGACGGSITGGVVYHGARIPELVGEYLYADFCKTWVRSVRVVGGTVISQRDYTPEFGSIPSIVSFGEDAAGEVYIVSIAGTIFRIVPAGG